MTYTNAHIAIHSPYSIAGVRSSTIEWANALVPPTPLYWGIQIGLSYDYGLHGRVGVSNNCSKHAGKLDLKFNESTLQGRVLTFLSFLRF